MTHPTPLNQRDDKSAFRAAMHQKSAATAATWLLVRECDAENWREGDTSGRWALQAKSACRAGRKAATKPAPRGRSETAAATGDAGGSDRLLDLREDLDQLGAKLFDGRDDGHRDAGSDDPVFDRRRAGLVFQEPLHLQEHCWPPIPSQAAYITESFW